MKARGKIIAWVCIFNTFWMGCYSSAFIDPEGAEEREIYSCGIESVIMRDCTSYVFDHSPVIADDSIVGVVNGKQVAIPISNLRFQKEKTYSGDNWPFMVSDSVIGIVIGSRASIPMSGAESEDASSSISTETVLLVLGIAGAIVVISYVVVPELEKLRHFDVGLH